MSDINNIRKKKCKGLFYTYVEFLLFLISFSLIIEGFINNSNYKVCFGVIIFIVVDVILRILCAVIHLRPKQREK